MRGSGSARTTQPFWVLSDIYWSKPAFLREDTWTNTKPFKRLKQGDAGGLEYLVRAHQVRAIRTAFLITGDRGLAEEVVQETFLRLLRSIRTFDSARPFEPWFLRSVVNAALRVACESQARCAAGCIPKASRRSIRLAARTGIPTGAGGGRRDRTGGAAGPGSAVTAPASGDRAAVLPGNERSGDGLSIRYSRRDHQVAAERCAPSPARSMGERSDE